MGQFWNTVVEVLEDQDNTAAEVLANDELLKEFVNEVMAAIELPCTIWQSEAGVIHSLDGGESYVLLNNGYYDTGSSELDITSFDPEYRVKEVLESLAKGWPEE